MQLICKGFLRMLRENIDGSKSSFRDYLVFFQFARPLGRARPVARRHCVFFSRHGTRGARIGTANRCHDTESRKARVGNRFLDRHRTAAPDGGIPSSRAHAARGSIDERVLWNPFGNQAVCILRHGRASLPAIFQVRSRDLELDCATAERNDGLARAAALSLASLVPVPKNKCRSRPHRSTARFGVGKYVVQKL